MLQGGSSLFRVSCLPHRLKGTTASLHQCLGQALVAEDREFLWEQQTEFAVSPHRPLEMSAGRNVVELLTLPLPFSRDLDPGCY
jgi:hypothetical protein